MGRWVGWVGYTLFYEAFVEASRFHCKVQRWLGSRSAASMECRVSWSDIEDGISRSGKLPEYSSLHAVISYNHAITRTCMLKHTKCFHHRVLCVIRYCAVFGWGNSNIILSRCISDFVFTLWDIGAFESSVNDLRLTITVEYVEQNCAH
jgi:hypothetical protein